MKLYGYEDCLNLKIKDLHKIHSDNINRSQVKLISSFGFGKDVPLKAKGSYIFTKNNKKILDMTGGIGVLNHGHNHKKIIQIRKKFLNDYQMEVHKNYFSKFLVGLVNNLKLILPKEINYFYFPNSGSESVEGALKLSYKYFNGQRKYVMYSDISFHGKLIGAGSITSSNETSGFKFQGLTNKLKYKYNNIDSIKKLIFKHKTKNKKNNIYAIIVEPFSGQTCKSCSDEFLIELRKICDNEKIILIFDEVYSGFCKTGNYFNFQRVKGLIPDIVTFSKSFGGGKASIAGYGVKKKFHKKAYDNLYDATLHSTTYFGYAEEIATAMESIKIMIEEDFTEKSFSNSVIIEKELEKIKKKYSKIIEFYRGSGSAYGIKFKTNSFLGIMKNIFESMPLKFFKDKFLIEKIVSGSVIEHLYKHYSILTYFAINEDIIFKISPPVNIKQNDLKYFFSSLDKTLQLGIPNLIRKFIKNKYFA